jgi:hypothetical protein
LPSSIRLGELGKSKLSFWNPSSATCMFLVLKGNIRWGCSDSPQNKVCMGMLKVVNRCTGIYWLCSKSKIDVRKCKHKGECICFFWQADIALSKWVSVHRLPVG